MAVFDDQKAMEIMKVLKESKQEEKEQDDKSINDIQPARESQFEGEQTFTKTRDFSDKTVAICIPHQELVSMEWALNFRLLNAPSHYYFLNRCMPYDIARNMMTRDALEKKPDYIFYLDSDVKFRDYNAINILLEIAEDKKLDVVSGVYWAKHETINPCAFKNVGFEGRHVNLSPIALTEENIKQKNVIQCDTVGMGCCLVKATVFDKWEKNYGDKPWFRWGVNVPEKELELLDIYHVSEDFNFFLHLNKIGIHPHVACEVVCDHITWARKMGHDGTLEMLST